MISPQERRLLYTLAKKHFRNQGRIVDAGTFLGASTVTFAQGLIDNSEYIDTGNKNKPIISFDQAIVRKNFKNHAVKHGLTVLPEGESFGDLLRDLIDPYIAKVELVIGNLLQYDGDSLGEIEICFLDILKSEELNKHALSVFFPKLMPGAYVIQQDYFFDGLPFIKVAMEALAEHFDYLGEVRSSALFRLKSRISSYQIARVFNRKPSAHEQLQLHKKAETRTGSPSRQYLMQLSRSRLLASLGRVDDAIATWQNADKKYTKHVFKYDGTYKNNMLWRVDRIRNVISKCGHSTPKQICIKRKD
jgi:predicted O-methyltransferase YrrM